MRSGNLPSALQDGLAPTVRRLYIVALWRPPQARVPLKN